MVPIASIKAVTEDATDGDFQFPPMVLQECCRSAQKNAVLGENKMEPCTRLGMTKRKSAQDPNYSE